MDAGKCWAQSRVQRPSLPPHSEVRNLDPHFQMENRDSSCQHPAPTLWWQFCALKCAACAGDPHSPTLKAGDSGTSHTPCYSLETSYHFGSVLWKQILNSGYTLKSHLLKKIFAGYLSTGKLCLIRLKSMAMGQPLGKAQLWDSFLWSCLGYSKPPPLPLPWGMSIAFISL